MIVSDELRWHRRILKVEEKRWRIPVDWKSIFEREINGKEIHWDCSSQSRLLLLQSFSYSHH